MRDFIALCWSIASRTKYEFSARRQFCRRWSISAKHLKWIEIVSFALACVGLSIFLILTNDFFVRHDLRFGKHDAQLKGIIVYVSILLMGVVLISVPVQAILIRWFRHSKNRSGG